MGLFSFRMVSKRVNVLRTNCSLRGCCRVGRSTIGTISGSYASLFSSEKILLLFTRPADWSFSMLARRLADITEGDCERSGVPSNSWREGDMPLRVDQKSWGEGFAAEGEGEAFSLKGEGSSEGSAFCGGRG